MPDPHTLVEIVQFDSTFSFEDRIRLYIQMLNCDNIKHNTMHGIEFRMCITLYAECTQYVYIVNVTITEMSKTRISHHQIVDVKRVVLH